MRKIILRVTIIAVIFGMTSCQKNNPDCNLIPAKIIRYDCDRVIFQILTNDIIGDVNWEDVVTGQRYNNVVSYYNTCAIANITNGELLTLYVDLKKTTENLYDSECIQCQALTAQPPHTKVDFISVSKQPCSPRCGTR